MSVKVAEIVRRALLFVVALTAFGAFVWGAQRPAYADDPTNDLTFPTSTTAERTDIGATLDLASATAQQVQDDNLPFCALYKTSNRDRIPVPAEQKIARGATPCENGMAGPYLCSNVDLQAFVPLADFDSNEASSVWGWTDAASGREFALFGATDGTAFFEITNPTAPVYLGKLPSHTGTSIWRELKTLDNFVFVVSDGNGNHGIQGFDLTQLLDVQNPPVTFEESSHYGQVGSVHNMVIDTESGYGFAVGSGQCAGGLHMVDLNDPLNPTYAGCFQSDGYTHDAQCLTYHGPDEDYVGHEMCIASNEDTVTIVDVTDKANPVQISRTGYPDAGYTHQSWLTPDGNYMVLDDEFDEWGGAPVSQTYVWDMRDLDNPVLMDVHQGATTAIDHNQYTIDGYVFQANYLAGLRVLDSSDIANDGNLTEIGYFDIYPESDDADFGAAWNVYPYFPSGNVVVSGIEQGLFVLKPTNVVTQPPTAVELDSITTTSTTTPVAPFAIAAGVVGLLALGFVIRRTR